MYAKAKANCEDASRTAPCSEFVAMKSEGQDCLSCGLSTMPLATCKIAGPQAGVYFVPGKPANSPLNMAVAITEDPAVGLSALQPLWHEKAPPQLAQSCPDADPFAGWAAWQEHLRKRRKPVAPAFIS